MHVPNRHAHACGHACLDGSNSDRAKQWALLLPHGELAYRVALRRTGSRAEAEDCVHDAILLLVQRNDLDPRRVPALLAGAALHIAIDHRRAAGRRQRAAYRLGASLAADTDSPEDVVDRRDETTRLRAVVDQLPRREREVLLLRVAGYRVAEVGRLLGITNKTVEGVYTRARARAQKFMRDQRDV